MDEELARAQREEDAITKLLVLGTGESGKSTVFKQMKILYSVPDPPAKFIAVCRANLFGNAHTVALGMRKLNIAFATPEGKSSAEEILTLPSDGNVDVHEGLVTKFANMFQDSGVREAISRAAEFQLNDSTVYFWERASEILKPGYLPTEQDVLRARVRTTGIVQQNFDIAGKKYTMFDVGGQRNERRKWIHCFDNVTAVIFVTAISEYDQVLYEDENTNRMDEALTLFEQICNHSSFNSTSMILFLNKRDLFMEKLNRVPLTRWNAAAPGQEYGACIDFIKGQFCAKNADPTNRQIYTHATCATDTSNVSFVMDSVFDVILKDNLRKMAGADLSKILDAASGGGGNKSAARTGPGVWTAHDMGKTVLVAACYTENLSESKVLVSADDVALLPAVEIQPGKPSDAEFMSLMELGKDVPVLTTAKSEVGTFLGNFKDACSKMRELLGVQELGFIYDQPIKQVGSSGSLTLIVCVRKLEDNLELPGPFGLGFKPCWVDHVAFENACYKKLNNVDTVTKPFTPVDKNEEFNPFAAIPVGDRWFKGITLFTSQVLRIPDKGVYLGVFKVLNEPTGFKVMVNEHNRIMIPIIFLTEKQLTESELTWIAGVRIREKAGIDMLEGAKPNRGWLGPEMSGEDGATFPEKLWWAVDEAKSRFGLEEKDSLGEYYDTQVLDVDEKSNMQLVMYATLATDAADILPGHIWLDRQFLEVQNMKYYCPTVLDHLLREQALIKQKYLALDDGGAKDLATMTKVRSERDKLKEELNANVVKQQPLKWVNRVIMWCADKMPSFGDGFSGNPAEVVAQAMAANRATAKVKADRKALLAEYYNK